MSLKHTLPGIEVFFTSSRVSRKSSACPVISLGHSWNIVTPFVTLHQLRLLLDALLPVVPPFAMHKCLLSYISGRKFSATDCVKVADDSISSFVAFHRLHNTKENKSRKLLHGSFAVLYCLFCTFSVFMNRERSCLTTPQITAPPNVSSKKRHFSLNMKVRTLATSLVLVHRSQHYVLHWCKAKSIILNRFLYDYT